MAQAKKPKKTTTKSAPVKTNSKKNVAVSSTPRRLKPEEKAFPLNKWPFNKEKLPRIVRPPLPNVLVLFKSSIEILQQYWKLFLGIVAIYAVLNLALIKGLASGFSVEVIKADFSGAFHGSFNSMRSGASLFINLLGGTNGSTNPSAGAYQAFLVIVTSLVLIWALRQVHADIKPKIRESFYKGVYPLVPVLVVLLVIGLEIIPAVFGFALLGGLFGSGIALSVLEKIVFITVCVALIALSFRWFCSTVFALYIATLPDMTPLKAMRSARALVKHRRLEVLRKIIFLPVAVLVIGGIIMSPIILFLTPLTAAAFFILGTVALALVHSYLYTTYRELL